MPRFDIEPKRVNAFRIDDQYLVKHYFEREDLFALVQAYYNRDKYRIEIPVEAFEGLRATLSEEYVELVPVETLEPYCVVKEQYTPYADILRNAVVHWQRRGYNFFLMKDELAVREAVEHGATHIRDTDLVLGV